MPEQPQTQTAAAEARRLEVNLAYGPLVRRTVDTRYVLVTGGRGSGKSFAVALALTLMLREPGYRILFTRYTLTSAWDSIIPEFTEKVDLLQLASEFDVGRTSIANRASGSDVLFRGIKAGSLMQTAKLKSLQGVNVWVLDEAQELPEEEIFDTIDFSVRDPRQPNLVLLVMNPAHKAHWIYKRWFDGLPAEFSGVRNGVTYIHTTYADNKHLRADYRGLAARMKAANPPRYNRVWRGHWAEQVEGALWTWEMIDRHRVREGTRLPEFGRVVVGVDPAGSDAEAANETGIVCAALGVDGHYYILSDVSRRATPLEWATCAQGEYRRRMADRVVGEQNFGGDMVETTLRQVCPDVSYAKVNASRGKIIRAEPVAALAEMGTLHHVGYFPALETEQMTYTGKRGEESPNRLDAMVWAVSALMDGTGRAEFATESRPERDHPELRRGGERYLDLTPSERRGGGGRGFADMY